MSGDGVNGKGKEEMREREGGEERQQKKENGRERLRDRKR